MENKHSYEEHVINLLLLLFHIKFQKVKTAFCIPAFTHNKTTDLKLTLRATLYYILHGWIKGTKYMCMQLTIRVISILEYVNNNKCKVTRLNLKFTHKIYTWLGKCLLKHSYNLATFSHIRKFARPIAIDYGD